MRDYHGIGVAAKKLGRCRDRTCSVFGPSYFEVLTVNGYLLQCERLGCIFRCLEVYKGIVAITTNPDTHNNILLKDLLKVKHNFLTPTSLPKVFRALFNSSMSSLSFRFRGIFPIYSYLSALLWFVTLYVGLNFL